MQEYISINGVEQLCQAIIVQAAKDYRQALRALTHNPLSDSALDAKNEIERFFRSGWYEMMTDIEGEYLIRRLQEELK